MAYMTRWQVKKNKTVGLLGLCTVMYFVLSLLQDMRRFWADNPSSPNNGAYVTTSMYSTLNSTSCKIKKSIMYNII